MSQGTLELILVRHGQSEADLLNVIECNADFALTALGQTQAQRLALKLADLGRPLSALYSSPLQRARNTAEILLQSLDLSLTIEARLAEKNVGDMAGMDREEAARRFPLPAGGLLPHQRMGGGSGESRLDFNYRIQALLWELKARHTGQSICIVAHGGVLDEVLRWLLQSRESVQFASGDAAYHHLSWGERVIVHALNARS